MNAYSSIQHALQSRYASDRAAAGHEQLGYAQIASDASLRQQALGLQAAEVAQRPGLIEATAQAHARAALDTWTAQRAWTQRDEMELNRQKAAVGEILTKVHSGELSDEEGYRMIGHAAPLVDALEARQKYSANKAMEEQRQQHAALFQAQKQQIDTLNALQSGEMEGQIDQYVLPEFKGAMADHMRRMFPGLQPGTPEYDAKLKLEASQMGAAMDMVKVPGKGLVPLAGLKAMLGGAAGAGGGSAGTAGATGAGGQAAAKIASEHQTFEQHQEMFKTAYDIAAKQLAKKDAAGNMVMPDPAAVQQLAEEVMRRNLGFHTQRRQEAEGQTPQNTLQSAVKGVDARVAAVQASPALGPQAKAFLGDKLAEVRGLVQQYPPGGRLKMPPSVEEKIARLLDQVEAYNLNPAPQPGASPGG